MTAPQGAVPAKMASSPTAKMTMNHTKPALLAGGIQKAATIARKPTTALMPAHTSKSGWSCGGGVGGETAGVSGGTGEVADKLNKAEHGHWCIQKAARMPSSRLCATVLTLGSCRTGRT